jgi:hypothetical protein
MNDQTQSPQAPATKVATKKATKKKANKPAVAAKPKAPEPPVVLNSIGKQASPGEQDFTITLRPHHAQWLRQVAHITGRTPQHQIEKLVREAYAADASRAGGATVLANSEAGEALAAEMKQAAAPQ